MGLHDEMIEQFLDRADNDKKTDREKLLDLLTNLNRVIKELETEVEAIEKREDDWGFEECDYGRSCGINDALRKLRRL